MTKFDLDDKFPAEIASAFETYSTPMLSRGFDARFWAQFEARRDRYRGFVGLLRRTWEVEIAGVAVWRLAASTFSGGALCALFVAFAFGTSTLSEVPLLPAPSPEKEIPLNAMNSYAFYRREWERDFLRPPTRPRTTAEVIGGGGFSWTGLNATLA